MKNRIVVDANIFFSALLKNENPYIKILMGANCKFFAPKFVFIEIFKHKEKIVKYSSLSEEELLEALEIVLDQVEFISLKEIDKQSLQRAYELSIIDLLDAPFVALSLFLDARLWTGDKRLCRFLKDKGFNICITTQELFDEFLII
jgi:predicted nucleic acid-binding protein